MSSFPDNPNPQKADSMPLSGGSDGHIPKDATRFHVAGNEGSSGTDFLLVHSNQEEGSPEFRGSLGEYLVGEKIGSGGMGQVFRATHRTMEREVAIKVLPRALAQHPEVVSRFYSEIRAVARLMHPNIVTAFDAGNVESIHFLVMELIDGAPLSTQVASHGPMGTGEVIHFLVQAASALAYAHSQGVIHRDIKPSNLILTSQGAVKILDFGLARLADEVLPKSSRRNLLGTVEYMSPEQVEAPDHVDHRTDLYSLGATVYYLLTGRPMFSGEPVEIALAHVRKTPPALYEVCGNVDLRLDAVVQKLIAKRPDDRYPDASSVIAHLQKLGLWQGLVAPPVRRQRVSDLQLENATRGPFSQSTASQDFAAVGVDLGTLATRASYLGTERNLVELPLDGDSLYLRNAVWSSGDKLAVGELAWKMRALHPDQVFHGMQRWIGLPLLDRSFGGRQVPPEILVAALLHQVVLAGQASKRNLTHAVITIPACYDQLHRHAIANASRCAGLEVLQLLDKPLAAALAFLETRLCLGTPSESERLAKSDEAEPWLVVMLSGSACEASVLHVQGRAVRSVASYGDWKRGKGKWQRRIAEHLAKKFQDEHGYDVRSNLIDVTRLQRSAEMALDRLSVSNHVEVRYEAQQKELKWTLERPDLLSICSDMVSDLVDMPAAALDRAGLGYTDIRQILLIGDLLKIPSLQQIVLGSFSKRIPWEHMTKADLARGAALQAHFLMPPCDREGPQAESSTTYDFGLLSVVDGQAMGGPKVLIPAQSSLPNQISRTLRLTSGPQQKSVLQFLEGTRFGHPNWYRLGAMQLAEAFPNRPPSDPLQLRLEVDSSGILSSRLTWLSGNSARIVPPLADPTMDVVAIEQWRKWIETLMLCKPSVESLS